MATGDLYGAQLCNLPWIPHLLNTALISKCIFKCVEFIFAVCVCASSGERKSCKVYSGLEVTCSSAGGGSRLMSLSADCH